MLLRLSAVVCIAFSLLSSSAFADQVTTGSVVAEMVDMDRLADMPANHYETLQFTSYDRRANLPGGPEWFSNSDGFGWEPVPAFAKVLKKPNDKGEGEFLVCDIEGAGCIVRTWTAAINGKIRMYLDGNEEPVYEGPAEQFFHRPYEKFVEGTDLAGDALKGTLYQRDAAYCPIPFAKGCRIEWIGNLRQVHFYYVQIRKFDENIDVKTFSPDDLKTYRKEIDRTMKVLSDPDAAYAADAKKLTAGMAISFDTTIEPGKRTKGFELESEAALTELMLKVSADNEVDALRQTIMHISCDGWTNAQVQTPVGDFFGAAPGINPYVSMPFTVTGEGNMTSRFVMPFKKSIYVEFENLGDQTVQISGAARVKQREWHDDKSMHFYARWRMTHDITTRPPVDMPYLLANGSGRYVGSATFMLNPARGTHPSGSWWGEGDEKIFVDDDTRPSSFGTGSEDYYNYAWSAVDIFFHPYCGQPRNDGPANRGFVTNNRWHIIDDLPFKSRISFYMELLAHHRVEGFSYGSLAYHYGRPGIIDDHRVITSTAVPKPRLPGTWTPLAYRGSAGATFFEPENVAETEHSLEEGALWTEGQLMVWKPKQKGDKFRLVVPVKKAGKYQMRLGMALDGRSGKVSATLDGEGFDFGIGGSTDLHTPHRQLLRASDSKVVSLSPGDHVVELTYEDGKPFVGIDFIWLQPR